MNHALDSGQGAYDFHSHFSALEWNYVNAVPESSFLVPTRSEASKLRLHAMGNLVVPQQAFTAMCLLAGMRS